jgi:hypothetical protein
MSDVVSTGEGDAVVTPPSYEERERERERERELRSYWLCVLGDQTERFDQLLQLTLGTRHRSE